MTQQNLFTAPAKTATTTQATFISDNKSIVKQIWDKFWTNGFSNPMTAIEQFSYLLFMKQLDDEETRRVKMKVFRPQTTLAFEDKENLRWSFFKNIDDPVLLGKTVREAFNFVRNLGDAGGAYVKHMRGAIFLLSPEGGETALLGDLITLIDQLRFDTSGEGEDEENLSDQGDLYEFMLSQLTSSGKNGQFRTPRHIINLMVEMMAPRPQVVEEGKPYRICDPSCGTGGFLISAASYVKKLKLTDEAGKETRWMTKAEHSKLFEQMLVGYDFDATMLRIASMNLMLHGVSDPTVEGINSVSQSAFEAHDLATRWI
jgi:type I restriction enzyme M protein